MNSKQAKVILSFDFEIGWGDITNPMWRIRESEGVYQRLRSVLPELLQTMDDCDFPATWATVGGMIEHPKEHDFEHLPSTAKDLVSSVLNEAQPESFDGRDLFDMLLSANAAHDIGSHSYCHVPFHYPDLDEEFALQEMQRFHRVMSTHGHKTDRFVFPENSENFHDALVQSGIKIVRVAADNYFQNRWLYLASTPFMAPPMAREESGAATISRHYGSMLFNAAGQDWRIPLIERRLALGLKKAIRDRETLHIWAHPFNFAQSDKLKLSFTKALENIARLRDKGALSIEPM